jgi:hypothetical protein
MATPALSHFHGPLRVCAANPRYFCDDRGQAIYLTGSHTWANVQELYVRGDAPFDNAAYLDMLVDHGHNFARLWQWLHPVATPWTTDEVRIAPLPYARPGPGLAADGEPRFDLTVWNKAYFDRLRQRVIAAGERGIYVSVMFFEGWCLKNIIPQSNPWRYHPYNAANNVNGVHGDLDGDGLPEVFTLEVAEVVAAQEALVRKVIDTLGDLDHVIWEILNEIPVGGRYLMWHLHMIDTVHAYEATRPKQHPVGMTAEGGSEDNRLLFASKAEWVAPGNGPSEQYRVDPPDMGGCKVVLADTDHMWGHGGSLDWVWKNALRGNNPLFMDSWQPLPGRMNRPGNFPGNNGKNDRDYPDWEPVRRNLGYARNYIRHLDLNHCEPHGELASSGYCLAWPGHDYLVFLPTGGAVDLDLVAVGGQYAGEWFQPETNTIYPAPTPFGSVVNGGAVARLSAPFEGPAVLSLSRRAAP